MRKGLIVSIAGAGIAVIVAVFFWFAPTPERVVGGGANFVERKDGAGIWYYTQGEESAIRVVLLASLGRSTSDFNELAASLNGYGYRTLAIEVRGVGRSDLFGDASTITLFDFADDVEAALVADGADASERVFIIGHAFGNRLARAYATRYPHRIRRVVLLAAGGSQNIEADPKVARALRDSFDKNLSTKAREEAIAYAFFADQNKPPQHWLNGWHQPGAKLSVAAVQNTPPELWRGAGGSAPMLVIQAAEDRIAPAETTSARLKADFPDRTTVITVPSAGHALLPEAPGLIALHVHQFIAE